MITKPTLPPIAGYVEVEVDKQRKYKDVKTGEVYAPGALPDAEENTVWDELDAAYQEGVDSI